jgi:hypothetical protein
MVCFDVVYSHSSTNRFISLALAAIVASCLAVSVFLYMKYFIFYYLRSADSSLNSHDALLFVYKKRASIVSCLLVGYSGGTIAQFMLDFAGEGMVSCAHAVTLLATLYGFAFVAGFIHVSSIYLSVMLAQVQAEYWSCRIGGKDDSLIRKKLSLLKTLINVLHQMPTIACVFAAASVALFTMLFPPQPIRESIWFDCTCTGAFRKLIGVVVLPVLGVFSPLVYYALYAIRRGTKTDPLRLLEEVTVSSTVIIPTMFLYALIFGLVDKNGITFSTPIDILAILFLFCPNIALIYFFLYRPVQFAQKLIFELENHTPELDQLHDSATSYQSDSVSPTPKAERSLRSEVSKSEY